MRGTCFLFQPFRQFAPLPDQAFVADVDKRVIVERLRIGGLELWGEEVDAGLANLSTTARTACSFPSANLTNSPNGRGRRTASATVAPEIRPRNTASTTPSGALSCNSLSS